MDFNEREAITDPALLKKCLAVIGVVVLSFVFARSLGLEAATIGLYSVLPPCCCCNAGRITLTSSPNW
jgi:Na+/H+ antiporter NhaD/arsenite permease-like protein